MAQHKKLKKLFKKTVKAVKAKGIDKFFTKEGNHYTPHGLISEAGKEFPGVAKHFESDEKALEWAKKMSKHLKKK
tara:strand:- start:36 stop:260 length:225 start_codon:yes stop_codon:yes gene_type:complete